MYQKILVAIDGSEVGDAAFESAMQLAKAENAELFALYVIEYPKLYIPDASGYDPAPIYDALTEEGAHITQEAGDRIKANGINGKSGVVDNFFTGNTTAEQIEHTADTFGADLVVLGTHGRSGFKRLMLGSVAEAVTRMSTRPVLLVPYKRADA